MLALLMRSYMPFGVAAGILLVLIGWPVYVAGTVSLQTTLDWLQWQRKTSLTNVIPRVVCVCHLCRFMLIIIFSSCHLNFHQVWCIRCTGFQWNNMWRINRWGDTHVSCKTSREKFSSSFVTVQQSEILPQEDHLCPRWVWASVFWLIQDLVPRDGWRRRSWCHKASMHWDNQCNYWKFN